MLNLLVLLCAFYATNRGFIILSHTSYGLWNQLWRSIISKSFSFLLSSILPSSLLLLLLPFQLQPLFISPDFVLNLRDVGDLPLIIFFLIFCVASSFISYLILLHWSFFTIMEIGFDPFDLVSG